MLVLPSVFLGATGYAILGLMPVDLLAEPTLHGMIRVVGYCIFDLGSLGLVLFLGAASLAKIQSAEPPRWLAWWGLATAAASFAGMFWIASAELDGPLMMVSLLARGSFLLWVAAAGAWFYRTTPLRLSASPAA